MCLLGRSLGGILHLRQLLRRRCRLRRCYRWGNRTAVSAAAGHSHSGCGTRNEQDPIDYRVPHYASP